MSPSPSARLLVQSLLAVVCGAAACADREGAAGSRVGEIGAGGFAAEGGASGRPADGQASGKPADGGASGKPADGASGGAAGASPAGAAGASLGGGATASGGSTSAGSAGTANGATSHPCLDAQTTAEPGLQRCADGSLERIASATCATPVLEMDPCPAPTAGGQAGAAGAPPPGCADACSDGPYGRHRLGGGGAVVARYGCEYFCATDADCPSGRGCLCGAGPNGAGRCLPGECGTSADCPGGETCRYAQYAGICGQGYPGLFCVGEGDVCVRDADCPAAGHPQGLRCASLGADLRCVERGAGGCGRPIFLGEAGLVATLIRGGTWC